MRCLNVMNVVAVWKKFIRTINRLNFAIHVMYGFSKNEHVHPVESLPGYINMITQLSAKNVKTIDHVYVVNELITLSEKLQSMVLFVVAALFISRSFKPVSVVGAFPRNSPESAAFQII